MRSFNAFQFHFKVEVLDGSIPHKSNCNCPLEAGDPAGCIKCQRTIRTPTCWAAKSCIITCVRRVWSFSCSQVAGTLHSSVVHRLEYVSVQLSRLLTFEWEAQLGEGICQPLHAETDGPMSEVGSLGIFDRVEVAINDSACPRDKVNSMNIQIKSH